MMIQHTSSTARRFPASPPWDASVNAPDALQILAAMSHDLQSPITRMQLRAEQMEDHDQRRKLQRDLDEMVVLVREGLSYARTLHGSEETARMMNLDALLDAMRCDRADAGQQLKLTGRVGRSVCGRPLALRRIVTNLVDNAFKYACEVEMTVAVEECGGIAVCVLDRGVGIPESELEAVFRPFYRLQDPEGARVDGTGLGLAIAQRLACAFGAKLSLSNRQGGGLIARLAMSDLAPGIRSHS